MECPITFVEVHKIKVYFGSSILGTIRKELCEGQEGYRYYPNHSKVGGEFFLSLSACKASL